MEELCDLPGFAGLVSPRTWSAKSPTPDSSPHCGRDAGRDGAPGAAGPAPFTLALSHDVPVSDPDFCLRVQWFRRGGQAVRGVRREGTRLIAEGREFLVLEPLYSALEGVEAVNGASGDDSPDGLDRRMAAFSGSKGHLTHITGIKADDYFRGLAIHQAMGLGIDLESGEGAPFLPALYGDTTGDAAQGDGEEGTPEREPLLRSQQAGLL